MRLLPETDLRIKDIDKGRVNRQWEHDFRCLCGRCYLSRSDTHLTCPDCKRAWTIATAEKHSTPELRTVGLLDW